MVERWSGVESLVDESAMSDAGGLRSDAAGMRPTSLFIARREPSGLSFMLIFWRLQLFSFTIAWIAGRSCVLQ